MAGDFELIKTNAMKNHFKHLWNYNDWANEKVLHHLQNNTPIEKSDSLMSHILSAQFIWYLRVMNKPISAFPIWEVYKLSELLTMNEDSTKQWQLLIDETVDFSNHINYTNHKGDNHTSSLEQIVTHLINHGTHHRAQISSLIRAMDQQPPVLDYIFYSRQ